MQKLTQTWGERFAREAKSLLARRQPHVTAVEWLAPLVRRVSPHPLPTTRYARIEPAERTRSEATAQEDGELIPADVRDRLRDIVGPAIDKARVHTDLTADAFARSHAADAVTVGNDIMFRAGAYQPHAPRGFALLAHEATHVAASATAASSRATAFGAAAEETAALATEARALAAPPLRPMLESARPTFEAHDAGPDTRSPAAPAASGNAALAVRPMTAASDRALTAAPTSAPFDVGELKRSIYRELLQQIRSDAERGG